MTKDTSNFEELVQRSNIAGFVADILEFYVPLGLQLPKLRDEPQFMEETVKAESAGGVTDVATRADVYVQRRIKEELLKRHLWSSSKRLSIDKI